MKCQFFASNFLLDNPIISSWVRSGRSLTMKESFSPTPPAQEHLSLGVRLNTCN